MIRTSNDLPRSPVIASAIGEPLRPPKENAVDPAEESLCQLEGFDNLDLEEASRLLLEEASR
jgi:hypothetical protein